MYRTIGKVLLMVGVLITAGVVIWGWNTGVFDCSRTGAGIGLRRVFFLVLYLPIPIAVTSVGFALAFKDSIAKSILAKKVMLVIAALLLLFAMSFVAVNVMGNIRYYGGGDVLKVLMLNLIFALPILFLSGLLFFMSRVVIKN